MTTETQEKPRLRPHKSDPAAHGGHEEEVIPKDLPRIRNRTMIVVAVIAAVLLLVLFLVGYIPHRNRLAEAQQIATDRNSKPIVDVTQPKRQEKGFDLVLPGEARAFQETSIYPRSNGYLSKLLVDIGDRVKAGQLLAEIDTPEIDAELNQSRATLQQVKTNVAKSQADYALAESTFNRYESLAKTGNGAVTPQDLDEKLAAFNQAKAALDSARAAVTASEAAVQRLSDMQSFGKVTAPFDGIVSARNYDIGALLSPTNTGDGKQLFRLTKSDTLRVFASVPQSYASSVKLGQPAVFTVRNFPGKTFPGKVTRTTGEIDASTRTLRMQIDLPNPDYTLWAGMYGQVKLTITPDQPPLIVPTSAMIFRTDGTMVAIVQDGKVHLQKVVPGRDFGTEMEVLEGLKGDEKIVTNPGERLAEGVEVQVVEKKAASSKPAQ